MKLLSSLAFLSSLGLAAAKGSLRGSSNGSVLCRMIMFTTFYDEDDAADDEEWACAVILNGKESMHTIPISLPEELEASHAMELRLGKVFVEISDAQFEGGIITTQPSSKFSVVDQGMEHLRHRSWNSIGR